MNKTAKNLIYLLTCAVNGITPDTARAQDMDLEMLYNLAKYHTIQSSVCIALERAGVKDKVFHEAYKCPLLYPVGIVYRWGRILLIRRKNLSVIIKILKKA